MTVSTQESIIRYKGNPSTKVYQIPFRWLEDTDIIIQKQDAAGNIELLTYLTDYTLTGEGQEQGGYVTFVAPFLTTDTIVIQRVVPYTQETDYEENEIFPADSHEAALDKLTMEVQQLAEESSRALKINVFSTVDPEDVVNHVERVYQSVDNIDAVSKDLPNVDVVAENIDAVKNTGNNIQSVITASDNIDSIKKVTSSAAAISITAANIEDVKTTAKNINSVKTTSDNIADIKTNATNITDINTNAANIGSIKQVADIRNNVTLVALNNRKVTTVADNIDNVNAVANNASNINTVASNITDINNAQSNAQIAKDSAISAKTSENNAKDWADKAEDFYNKSETLGDYVQITLTPTPENPISTVTFEKKCSEKQFLSIWVDRVKLLPSEYTLAPDGMSVTLSQPVSSSVPLEVDYFVGMSNTVAEDLQQQINDITAGSLKDAVTTNTDQIITGNKSFTGTITAITQPNTDNSINVATTAYVKNVLDEASPTNMVTTDTKQLITAVKELYTGGEDSYSRPIIITMPTSSDSDPTETKSREIAFMSSEGAADQYEGSLTHTRFLSGESYTGLRARRLVNGEYKNVALGVGVRADGTTYATAPTPPIGDNTNSIATTAYINTKFQVVTALPADADDNTFYFIY